MKTKVVLGEKAQKVSAVVGAMAIAAVVGVGGLTLTNGAASAVTPKTTGSNSSSSSSTNKGTGTGSSSSSSSSSTGSSSSSGSSSTTTPETPSTTTDEAPATTPDTGFFTGDGEFTKADGMILVTGALAVILGGYVVYHNRKTIFRGRVNFGRR